MLFNSYVYIALFLPCVLIGFFLLSRSKNAIWQRLWLVIASFVFYGWWNLLYVPLLFASILINFLFASYICRCPYKERRKKFVLVSGLAFNVVLLGYFKYVDFFISTLNDVVGSDIVFMHVALPLAISFFTFQQIAYLVDCSRRHTIKQNLLNYTLFVTYFPQLIAGPIVHHSEMMPQFSMKENRCFSYQNFSIGITRFVVGLFKKIVLADTFALWVTPGFNSTDQMTFGGAWFVALSYALQIYFDFSGYTDMAIGSAKMMNITLPENFLSPYKSTNVQDFWKTWHCTLSRFLRDYIYIPLGGNRHSKARSLANIVITFLIGGIWHGAGWTYVLWGALHGCGAVIHRSWTWTGRKLPVSISWIATFVFVVVCWVFFRATSLRGAVDILYSMSGLNGIALPQAMENNLAWLGLPFLRFGNTFGTMLVPPSHLFVVFMGIVVAALLPNSQKIVQRIPYGGPMGIVVGLVLIGLFVLLNRPSEFIYFQF